MAGRVSRKPLPLLSEFGTLKTVKDIFWLWLSGECHFLKVVPCLLGSQPGGNPGAKLKSIPYRCHPIPVVFVWGLTKETINLPLGCLKGGTRLDAEVQAEPPLLPYVSWSLGLNIKQAIDQSSTHASTIQAHLLRRNVKRFRQGLVFKAHRFAYLSNLGSRVMKKRKHASTHSPS